MVETFEKVLDCVCALHNLRVLFEKRPDFKIVERHRFIPGDHVFHPKVPAHEVDLKIPKDEPNLDAGMFPHIRKFKEFLPSAAPAIKKALEIGGKECLFYPVVKKRGANLYNGSYVLQLQVQDEGLGVWTVKHLVGASYSYETHTGYFQLSKDNIAFNHICDCFSG